MASVKDNRNNTSNSAITGSHSLRLFQLFDIEIRLDLSVFVIFALIVFSLGNSVLPQWHPEWSVSVLWTTATISGVVFFASLLAHELSHAVVSGHYGIPVPRITLFLFGGMAECDREPDRPKVEFLVAIAGPLMSFAIAMICINLAFWLVGDAEVMESLNAGRLEAMAAFGPVATSLLWLGMINMVIAIFNMVPGFPMDGGRVFRAAIWAATGDLLKATRWASNLGRYFGWTLMFLGILSLMRGEGPGGLWWIMIGWFISSLAAASYRQQVIDSELTGRKVSDLMRTHFESVDAGIALSDFVDQYLLRSTQELWPVLENNKLAGVASLTQVTGLSPEQRSGKTVRNITVPVTPMNSLGPDQSAREALRQLSRGGDDALPVITSGEVVGLLKYSDVVKWMSLSGHTRL
ncbi:MAG: site-2 protease family protein [Pseudohongiella sp.]|nr:site-2 protease family protein [Pseudohongiella sp.]